VSEELLSEKRDDSEILTETHHMRRTLPLCPLPYLNVSPSAFSGIHFQNIQVFSIGSMSPLVSIIIPTRNSARTLEKCLESIKHQTYSNIEVIVVDNFSDDETIEIAKKYTEKTYEQ
jgi:cellulose synthase/poly-beta-1,6-N-acetylglucosamine synthase-like glycosyltransferase